MRRAEKIIITCAVTGAIHTPSMSPYLPANGDQIAAAAIGAARAGAAVIHLHARSDKDGRPDQSVEAFRPILQRIRSETDCIVNITTGGAPWMTVEERIKPAEQFKPELASLNMGSMNFGLFPMLERYRDFQHEWERDALEGSRDLIFRNTYKDIERILEICGANGTRFEFECYDTSHLYNLRHFVDRGLVRAPFLIQTVFGILGGIGSHPDDIAHMRRTADRLFGDDYIWSALGAGRTQIATVTAAAASGGHIRVGLEDNLWAGKGVLSRSNAEQVQRAVSIVETLGLAVASVEEARTMLDLKGSTNVCF